VRAELLPLVLIAVSVVAAADEPPALEVVIEQAETRVGDRVPVRVMARGGHDLLWGGLEVGDPDQERWAVAVKPREVSGTRPPSWELVLVPLDVGEVQLPPFRVSVRGADGGAVVAPSILPSITVSSVLPPEGEAEAAPLRDPIGVTGFPWEWVAPLLVPFLGIAAVVVAWSRRRRAADGVRADTPPPPMAEFEALVEHLEGRVGHEPVEGLCDRLAFGMRRYLQRQSLQPAADMTSYELRLLVRDLGWPEDARRLLPSVMETADQVRFARVAAGDADLRSALHSARDVARSIDEYLARERAAETLEETG
jgi:hypothetical protein